MSVEQDHSRELLTPEYAGDILFWTFYLSQGLEYTQKGMFSYAHLTRRHWILTDEERMKANRHAYRKAKSVVTKGLVHRPIDQETTRLTVEDMGLSMQAIFNETLEEDGICSDIPTALQSIVNGMISQDEKNIVSGAGRPRKGLEKQSAYHHMRDPQQSIFCHFVMQEHRLGVPVLDEMLARLYAFVHNPNAPLSRETPQVIDAYNIAHGTAIAYPPKFQALHKKS